jgi:hypothetical protein
MSCTYMNSKETIQNTIIIKTICDKIVTINIENAFLKGMLIHNKQCII